MLTSQSSRLWSRFAGKHASRTVSQPLRPLHRAQVVHENGSIARALNFSTDAKVIDCALRPTRRFCENCSMFDRDTDDSGRCDVFAGKRVPTLGWCAAWASDEAV